MEKMSLKNELSGNSYPGRGIIIGKSADGKHAITAYFIMGRSENSRNRVFVEDGEGIRTQAFDPSKLTDPSLIIYAPVRVLGNKTIVTNGDQTDTIYELMDKQQTFEQALRTREFEPDAPNYTPRISGIMHIENGKFNYAMSILKSNNGNPESSHRYTFAYENPAAGEGIRPPVTVIHLPMRIRKQVRLILSILIWEMAIRCQVLRESRYRLQSRATLMRSPHLYGKT